MHVDVFVHARHPHPSAVLWFRYCVLSQLGFKTAVGMPFKDIATSDSVYLEQLPAADDKNARTALRRMQEVKYIPPRGLQTRTEQVFAVRVP